MTGQDDLSSARQPAFIRAPARSLWQMRARPHLVFPPTTVLELEEMPENVTSTRQSVTASTYKEHHSE